MADDYFCVPTLEYQRRCERIEYVGALLEAINLRDMGVLSAASINRLLRLAQELTEHSQHEMSKRDIR